MTHGGHEHRSHRPTHGAHHARFHLTKRESVFVYMAVPLVPLFVLLVVLRDVHSFSTVPVADVLRALGESLVRIVSAYVLVLVCGVGLGFATLRSHTTERILMPLWDVLESIPVLVFFPAAIAFFVAMGGTNVAAVVIMALSMLWNILFSVTSGLRLIPPNVRALGTVFQLSGFSSFFRITLPALFPALVTGSLLAWAEGWNMLMVAEVVHTYIPHGTEADDLFGIGTLMVHASTSGDTSLFAAAVGALILAVLCMNIAVWQPLLRASERFRFE